MSKLKRDQLTDSQVICSIFYLVNRKQDLNALYLCSFSACYRYTEWVFFDYPNFKPNFGAQYPFIASSELYDHKVDPGETINFVNHASYKEIHTKLAKMLRAGWRNVLPPSSRDPFASTKFSEIDVNVVEVNQIL